METSSGDKLMMNNNLLLIKFNYVVDSRGDISAEDRVFLVDVNHLVLEGERLVPAILAADHYN
jgi:hypothetical protein